MRWREQRLVAAAVAVAACAQKAPPRVVAAPSRDAAAPSSSASAAGAVSPIPDAQDVGPPRAEPARSTTTTPQHPPQSDPIPPPAPRCPNVGPLVKASAVVKREPPSGARPPTPQEVLDIELTVMLPQNPTQVTFAPNALTVYGGVLIERTRRLIDPTKAVLLIRPSGTVAREGSLMALFGLMCTGAEGNLRLDMTFALPPKDGDKVAIRRVEGY
jgi:hypothetical protein